MLEQLHTALHQGRGCHFPQNPATNLYFDQGLVKSKFENGRRFVRQAASERRGSCRAEIVGTADKVLILLFQGDLSKQKKASFIFFSSLSLVVKGFDALLMPA
jgi:hypothetical protein